MNLPSNPPTVLVAGAGGFIGRHVVLALQTLAPQIVVIQLDRVLSEQTPRGYCHDISVGAVDDLARIIRDSGATAVINCAGTTQSKQELLDADNVSATEKLVDAAARARTGVGFCHVGSAAEYEMLPRPDRTREDAPTRPQGEYGRSKLTASMHVLEASRQGRVAGCVLRLFNPIGMGMPGTQLVGRVLDYLASDSREPLRLGNLDSYRDYVDARDVARAIVFALAQAEAIRGEVFNIGSGTAHQTRRLVTGLLEGAHGKTFREDAGVGSARSEWASWQEADTSKAKAILGWEPQYSFEATIHHLASCAQSSPSARQ